MNPDTDNEHRELHYNHKGLITLPIEKINIVCPTRLYCHNNYLTELPENLPNSIIQLSCHDNHITYLPENLPTNLKKLYCANNNISKLPANLPKTITHIYIAHNPLQSLPIDLCKYTKLKTLDITATLLTELPDFPDLLEGLIFTYDSPIFKIIDNNYFPLVRGSYTIILKPPQIKQINEINSMRRTQARTRTLAPAIMEQYAMRTMHPKNLAPLLADPEADISEFMDAYIAQL